MYLDSIFFDIWKPKDQFLQFLGPTGKGLKRVVLPMLSSKTLSLDQGWYAMELVNVET